MVVFCVLNYQYCVVPENINAHPKVGYQKFPGRGDTKMEFPEGWGLNVKNLPWERYGYFLEQHIRQCILVPEETSL